MKEEDNDSSPKINNDDDITNYEGEHNNSGIWRVITGVLIVIASIVVLIILFFTT